jgi:drug/metabolite transporter (DMT)-like permease
MSSISSVPPKATKHFLVVTWLFCIVSSLRDIGAQAYFDQHGSPLELLLLIGFSATTLFGVIVTRSRRAPANQGSNSDAPPAPRLFDRWRFQWVLLLNLLTAVSWLATLAGLRGLLASSLAALLLGTIPLATLAFQWLEQRQAPKSFDVIGGLLVVVGGLLIAISETKTDARAPQALLASVLGGVTAAATNVVGGKLNKQGLSAYQLMSARFVLTVGVAMGCYLFYRVGRAPSGGGEWVAIAALGLVGFGLPMILIQKAIELGRDDGVRVLGFIIACIPILSVGFQSALGVRPAQQKPDALLGAVLISSGCLLTAWLRKRRATSSVRV